MRLFFFKISNLTVKFRDIILTDFFYIFPAFFKWIYRLKIKRDIQSLSLEETSGKRATLYTHGSDNFIKKETQAVLFLHGQHAHPLVLLHLADIAQKIQLGPVYSIYLHYDQINPQAHRLLIHQAADYIEQKVKESGSSLKGIIMIGHSMGAIEAAHKAFVEKDKRLSSVISIAGRLKVTESLFNPCSPTLKPTVQKVFEAILAYHEVPLHQIVGKKDWNASLEAMTVRKEEQFCHIIEDAMHLNILYHSETKRKLLELLGKLF